MIAGLFEILTQFKKLIDDNLDVSVYDYSVKIGDVLQFKDEYGTEFLICINFNPDESVFTEEQPHTGNLCVKIELLCPNLDYGEKAISLLSIILDMFNNKLLSNLYWLWNGKIESIDSNSELHVAYRYNFKTPLQLIDVTN